MLTFFTRYLNLKAGKKKYQRLFEDLYGLSLKGMNIGGGDSTETSGEELAAVYIKKQLRLSEKPIIFDVGANIGDYTILLKKVFEDRAYIFSFEPSKQTFKKLLLNTDKLTGIQQYNFGLGDKNNTLTLFTNAEASGLASVYERRLDHFNIEMDKTEAIEIKTIDAFCIENNIRHIHFLKIDVEGSEMNVLKGAKNMMLNNNIDFIQFEFGGCNIDSRVFFQDFFYLLKDKYYIYRILKDGLFKIEEYKEIYEAFITTNYLAQRINLD